MAPTLPRETQASAPRSERRDPFAEQLRLSRVHTRLVPMQQNGVGYSIDSAALDWFELPAGRGFAGYGLGRALGLLLDAMRGLSALNETATASGEPFAHGEFTPSQFRVDPLGVCRLVPLTTRHYISEDVHPPRAALGFLSPERLIGEKLGVRADVFSAGVLLWEALAGRRLTETESTEAIVDRLMTRRLRVPPLPPQLAWAVPLTVEVERALSVNEKRRFADCGEFSEVILRIAQDHVASQREIAAFFASSFMTAPSPEPSAAPSSVPVSRERPIASRGATFKMLPAVTLVPSAQRHATLKMNVTLRMAQVPLPIVVDAPAVPSQPPPSLLPALTPPLRRLSPPLLPPSSTTPVPTLPPSSTTPVPTLPPSSTPPVPTRLSLLPPTPASPAPSTTTPPAVELPRIPQRRPSTLVLVTLAILLVGAIVGARIAATRGAPHAATSPPVAPVTVVPATATVATGPIATASAEVRDDALDLADSDRKSATSVRAADLLPRAERSAGPPTPPPQSRPASSTALPRGKDYGI